MANHPASTTAPHSGRPRSDTDRRAGTTPTLTELVDAIQGGDDDAWSQLVERLTRPIRASLARFDVDQHQRNDAMAETWRVLYERLETVDDPEALPRWVAVVARNKILDILRRSNAGGPMADIDALAEQVGEADDDRIVAGETSVVLQLAVSRLSPREQAVIRSRVFTAAPESLKSLGARLDMPSGSIGPTLGRGLKKLRRDRDLIRFLSEAEGRNPQRAGLGGALDLLELPAAG